MTEKSLTDDLLEIKFISDREKEFLAILLGDLSLSGWTGSFHNDHLELKRVKSAEPESKNEIRRVHQLYRNQQLLDPSVRKFIKGLNTYKYFNGKRVSIKNLICDGNILVDRLKNKTNNGGYNSLPIQPYIQEASSSKPCPHTGFILSDIWRYFRHTWSTEYRSIPGRKINLLIRDAAAEFHPVIGILALTSPVLNLNVRDEALGLSIEKILGYLQTISVSRVKERLEEILVRSLEDIYIDDFLQNQTVTVLDLNYPGEETIKRLENMSRELSERHGRMMANENRDFQDAIDLGPDEILNSTKLNEACISPLFKGKRLKFLSLILRAKKYILPYLSDLNMLSELVREPKQEFIKEVLSFVLLKTKNDRLASNILDLSVCGSIAPYSQLVAGKLVSLLAGSPEVQEIYTRNYGKSPSIIASIMANKPVYKSTVLLGITTTSLYASGSSQYNRIKVTRDKVDVFNKKSKGILEYKNIGTSEGYGTFQFSSKTLKATSEFLSSDLDDKSSRSNSIFGEGSSPRMRRIREVLDRFKIPAGKILKHSYKRIVYLYPLVDNIQTEIMKSELLPTFILQQNDARSVSDKISEFWYHRWAHNRILNEEITKKIASNSFTSTGNHSSFVLLPEKEDE